MDWNMTCSRMRDDRETTEKQKSGSEMCLGILKVTSLMNWSDDFIYFGGKFGLNFGSILLSP